MSLDTALGDGSTWTANDNGVGPAISSYDWAYRCPTSQTWTAHPGHAKSIIWIEGISGNYDVRCVATFQPGVYPPSQKPPQTLTTQVSVAAPSSDGVMAGLNVPTTINGGELMVDFWIYSGGFKCGPYLQGSPDEKIRRPQFGQDSGWLLGPGAPFYLSDCMIKDIKKYNVATDTQSQATWNAIANGAVIDDFYQQNRLRVNDSCGDPKIFYFAEHHFQRIKVNATQWKLIEL